MKIFAAMVCALALAGCMTSEVSHTPDGVAGDGDRDHLLTVDIENVGWYLFDFIPIFCGNPDGVNKVSSCIFKDTLTLQNNIDELTRIVQREGAYEIGSIISHEETESVWILLLTRHGYHTSATLMRR